MLLSVLSSVLYGVSRILYPETDPTGSGGSGDGDGDGNGDGDGDGGGSFEERLTEAVEKETKRLREHRDRTIAEKKEMKARLDALSDIYEELGGDEGIKGLRLMRDTLEKDELGKLLAQGKTEEWFDKRAGAMRKDYEDRIASLQQKLDEADGKLAASDQKFNTKVLQTEILSACAQHGVVESAYDDVLWAAEKLFKHDDELKKMVIRDSEGSIVYGKDGKAPLSPGEWVASQKAMKRHWWPPSKGSDATGSDGGVRSDGVDLSDIQSVSDWRKVREKAGLKSGIGISGP